MFYKNRNQTEYPVLQLCFVLCVFLVYVYVYRYVGGWVYMPMHAEAEQGQRPSLNIFFYHIYLFIYLRQSVSRSLELTDLATLSLLPALRLEACAICIHVFLWVLGSELRSSSKHFIH